MNRAQGSSSATAPRGFDSRSVPFDSIFNSMSYSPGDTPAWDVYQRHLFKLRYGLPLWNPEPFPGKQEIACGSVVYPSVHGELIPLFNALKDETKQAHTPEHHEALQMPDGTILGPRDLIQTQFLSSRTVTWKDVSVEASAGM